MTTTYDMALYLAKHQIYYYPTPYNTKAGLSGTNGLKDAVNDDSRAQEWFQGTNSNIGINLKKSHLMVVDVDMGHESGIDGKHNLLEVFKQYGRLPVDTLIEKTPHGGIHYFFKLPDGMDIKTKVGAFFDNSGIDLMTNNVLISPSMIDGQQYELVSGSYNDIKSIPHWLLSYMQSNNYYATSRSYLNTGVPSLKKYTGTLLDKIVTGASKGQRNVFVTSIAGSMLAVGTDVFNAYELLLVINRHFVSPPLLQNELDTIYNSVITREISRLKVK